MATEVQETPEQVRRHTLKLALEALTRVEWNYSPSAWSPTCYWCYGYQRHPAMDQDYSSVAGHKPDCLRQRAIAALEHELVRP